MALIEQQRSIRSNEDDRIFPYAPRETASRRMVRGVLTARQQAMAAGTRDDEILVLQADADTLYGAGYLSAMTGAAEKQRGDFLLEGTSRPPPEFVAEHPGYCRLSNEVDASVQPLLVDTEDDVIVSDSVAGYLLRDYFRWGGYVREYNSAGDEIYVETSRLFIRGKIAGARRYQVPQATAVPSRREILVDPLRFFVTAGFPREASWNAAWRSATVGLDTLEAFERPACEAVFAEAIALRRRHLIALFALLPIHMATILGKNIAADDAREALREPLSLLPMLSREDLLRDTAPLFEALFSLVDFHPVHFEGL